MKNSRICSAGIRKGEAGREPSHGEGSWRMRGPETPTLVSPGVHVGWWQACCQLDLGLNPCSPTHLPAGWLEKIYLISCSINSSCSKWGQLYLPRRVEWRCGESKRVTCLEHSRCPINANFLSLFYWFSRMVWDLLPFKRTDGPIFQGPTGHFLNSSPRP